MIILDDGKYNNLIFIVGSRQWSRPYMFTCLFNLDCFEKNERFQKINHIFPQSFHFFALSHRNDLFIKYITIIWSDEDNKLIHMYVF